MININRGVKHDHKICATRTKHWNIIKLSKIVLQKSDILK